MNTGKTGLFLLLCVFIMLPATPQVQSRRLEQNLDDPSFVRSLSLQYPLLVRQFYINQGFQPAWIEDSSATRYVLELLDSSPNYGLRKDDYQRSPLSLLERGAHTARMGDSLKTEVQLTDALIHFIHDVMYGNKPPAMGYNGLDYSPDCDDIPALLVNAFARKQVPTLPGEAEPKDAAYDSVKQKITNYTAVISGADFKEAVITSTIVGTANKPLLTKLWQLGFIDSVSQRFNDRELKERVKQAQKLFNLLADGVLRSTSLEALNVPLAHRLFELNLAINTIRWLRCIRQLQKIIVVNIPSANLLVFDHEKIILESRIVVGKSSTPTPTLCSKITEVSLYPYWLVPQSIATKELLPSIKRDVEFLAANNYQVISREGKIMNPYKINWSSLSASNFPYVIRQSTGCDNALGLIKLNFYSPYSVYLHDTPYKSLFSFNRRYFSHGCMRVEKAMELAHLVLKNNTGALDTLQEKGCLNNQAPILVPADEIIPVFVLYNTAWIDANGQVTFSDDIYRKNRFDNK